MVSHAPDEAFLLLFHHFCVPGVTNHPCSLPTVTFHPGRRGKGRAVKKTFLCTIAFEHPSTRGFWDKAKLAGSGEPKDLTVKAKLSTDHSCLLLPPMVVTDSSPLKENVALCLGSSANKASPILTLSIIQLFLDYGFI